MSAIAIALLVPLWAMALRSVAQALVIALVPPDVLRDWIVEARSRGASSPLVRLILGDLGHLVWLAVVATGLCAAGVIG